MALNPGESVSVPVMTVYAFEAAGRGTKAGREGVPAADCHARAGRHRAASVGGQPAG